MSVEIGMAQVDGDYKDEFFSKDGTSLSKLLYMSVDDFFDSENTLVKRAINENTNPIEMMRK